MKLKVIIHEAEEGGFWAEVPAVPGCASQGETLEELMQNVQEAVEGCLSVEVAPGKRKSTDRIVEIAVGSLLLAKSWPKRLNNMDGSLLASMAATIFKLDWAAPSASP